MTIRSISVRITNIMMNATSASTEEVVVIALPTKEKMSWQPAIIPWTLAICTVDN